MFYADDAVFIGEWSESNITSLIHVLDCFHKVSGLKINMCKSKIMGIEVDNGKVSRAATKFGCLVLKAPFLYLGSYVGGDMNKIQSWKDIIDRIRRRLSRWKMKMLSIGGRLMLIKSVLGSMPIFHMSMFKVPAGVISNSEFLRSKFFNGHESSGKKASWVQWKKALAPKDNGGLGIFSLYALNRGLIFKWVWRFLAHEPTLWSRVIKAIHGANGKIDEISGKGANSCWINIIKEVRRLEEKGINLLLFMKKNLGMAFRLYSGMTCGVMGASLRIDSLEHNSHYAPFIIRGVVSVHRLVENEFVQRFTDFGISVSKNNAIPSNGIYEIDMHDLVPNKRIKKLQQEGLLKSTDDESFDQCVSCLSGKMTRKSLPHRPERATDLLGIIHTDVCDPLRHVSRQGASYFITFTDDYSRYGYVYLLKHKHENVDMTPYELGMETFLNLVLLKRSEDVRLLEKRDTPDKLEQRSVKCIFIGYPKETMGYYFYFPHENKIVVARYAEFFEKNLITQEVSGRARDLEKIQDERLHHLLKSLAKFLMEVKVLNHLRGRYSDCRLNRSRRAPNSLLYKCRSGGELHWTAVKNILKYLRNTKDMFLVYGGNPEAELRVDCYCNAGFETE
ncbi:hypothetical protein Tco_0727151 [Tanacetum coccineum]|uniref:Retroviral polymerase SH3-like domain-containing protein n=1 Tax=Tanacetum coccineum TaxID=301880 RepID=A0ABQ4YIJ1_9ASTR